MERTEHFAANEDEGETLVTPRFDRDETATAQPVVPLAVVSGEAELYDGAHRVGRRSWPLALVFVSALVGSLLGGAGLYFYQKSRQENAAPAQTTEMIEPTGQAAAPENTPPAPPTPVEEAALPVESPADSDSDGEVAEIPVGVEEKEGKKGSDREREESKRADAPPRRESSGDGAAKRGKRGERDEEPAPREGRPRRVGDDSSSSDDERDEEEARRVDSIVYERERRRERRRRRQPAVDRVRGIFEGQP